MPLCDFEAELCRAGVCLETDTVNPSKGCQKKPNKNTASGLASRCRGRQVLSERDRQDPRQVDERRRSRRRDDRETTASR